MIGSVLVDFRIIIDGIKIFEYNSGDTMSLDLSGNYIFPLYQSYGLSLGQHPSRSQ